MNKNFKVLILEHDTNDIELLRYELRRAFPGHEVQIVQTESDFTEALQNFSPDIILSDYSLPKFDGVSAFRLKQKMAPAIPFIMVSGTIGEENAVELIKNGLTDYALKDKLYSLTPKIVRALNEVEEKEKKKTIEAALQKSEANLRSIFDTTDVGLLFLNADYTVVAFNQVSGRWATASFGVALMEGINFKAVLMPERLVAFDAFAGKVLSGTTITYETCYPKTDGSLVWFSVNGKPVKNHNNITGICMAVTDITVRKQAEEQIEKMNTILEERVRHRTSELVEANTALEAFSYSVSHDLRSPLRNVMGFAQLIKKEHAQEFSADTMELFGHIEGSTKRMNSIIDDLLALAKFGKEKLHAGEVNMHKLFTTVWDQLLFSNTHRARLDIKDLPSVCADGSMLEQVIVNLLSNAIKYSSKKEKPHIQVGCTESEEGYTFYVKDNGAGFDMKEYERLFGAFQRLHPLSEFEGTGVGLMLIKRIIEKHGGKVWAEGQVGQGATFYFTLPKTMQQQNKGEPRLSF